MSVQTVNMRMSSYGHKHRVESWCRRHGHHEYIANGSFIVAAVGLGFPFRIAAPMSRSASPTNPSAR
jgi:hypothetical protein